MSLLRSQAILSSINSYSDNSFDYVGSLRKNILSLSRVNVSPASPMYENKNRGRRCNFSPLLHAPVANSAVKARLHFSDLHDHFRFPRKTVLGRWRFGVSPCQKVRSKRRSRTCRQSPVEKRPRTPSIAVPSGEAYGQKYKTLWEEVGAEREKGFCELVVVGFNHQPD